MSRSLPTLLLLHGVGQTRTIWYQQIQELSGDFNVVAPGVPSYVGAAWVIPLAASLRPPVVLAGIAEGAALALAVAEQRPDLVSALVLTGPVLKGAPVGRITVPTLVLRAARDRRSAADAERIAAALPGARQVSLPVVGKLFPLTAPLTFANVVRGFYATECVGQAQPRHLPDQA